MEATGKRFLLAIDVSGSMEGYKVLGSGSLSCRVASAAMAMVTAKTEDNYHMVGFSHKLVPIKVHARMQLDEVCRTISKVKKLINVLLVAMFVTQWTYTDTCISHCGIGVN